MIPVSFVTMAYALTQRRWDSLDEYSTLEMMLWQSSDTCLRHIKVYEISDIPAEWLHSTLPAGFSMDPSFIPVLPATYSTDSPQSAQYVIPPGNLQAAIILHAGELDENREAGVATPLSPAVLSLLEDLRVPTLQ